MNGKADLRREARARLATVPASERSRLGERIAAHVWTLPEMRMASTILLYASLPEEVPTEPIAAEIRRRGLAAVYPRCLPEGRHMTLHTVASAEDLSATGRYGITEPGPHCPTNDIGDIDLALIPGLGWDRAGHRLGRGAGYYDRLLSSPEWRGFRCGLFFAAQEVAAIPADPWDVGLDAVVTEDGVWRLRGE